MTIISRIIEENEKRNSLNKYKCDDIIYVTNVRYIKYNRKCKNIKNNKENVQSLKII